MEKHVLEQYIRNICIPSTQDVWSIHNIYYTSTEVNTGFKLSDSLSTHMQSLLLAWSICDCCDWIFQSKKGLVTSFFLPHSSAVRNPFLLPPSCSLWISCLHLPCYIPSYNNPHLLVPRFHHLSLIIWGIDMGNSL